MKIEFKNLVIRSSNEKDAPFVTSWWNNGIVMSHAGFPNGLNIKEDKVKEIISKNNDKNELLIIEIDGKRVGEMNYREIEDSVMEVGIKICDEKEQNKGYGTIIFNLFLSFLKNERKCQKVVLDTNLNNIRAQYFYQKLGFIKDRIDYDSWTDQLGEKQSSVHFYLDLV